VKCRIPVVLIVSEAETAGVASVASVIGILPSGGRHAPRNRGDNIIP